MDTAMSTAVLTAALAYAARGMAIFPATAAVKKSHKSAEHSNGARWGATRDPGEVRRDFTRFAGCRIGLPTGADNGIVVLETDTVEGHGIDGAASLHRLEAKHGALPNTLQAISPSGSVHRYFRHPYRERKREENQSPGDVATTIRIKSSASVIGDGIDVRGDGGMVIAPPSINPDGRRYRWLNRLPLAPMPDWLIELTREKREQNQSRIDLARSRTISQRAVAAIKRPIIRPNGYGAAALAAEIKQLASIAPGSRNAALNRASFSLHQLVAGGELDASEVLQQLVEAATANGLVHDDGLPSVKATIESGMRAGLQHPRSRGLR
jgi:hypothetical protein